MMLILRIKTVCRKVIIAYKTKGYTDWGTKNVNKSIHFYEDEED